MLTVHHLRRSQSERVLFLCEKLELKYDRLPTTAIPQ